MKMKLTVNDAGNVTLAYDTEDFMGEIARVEREFSCPVDGGYVREYNPKTLDWDQVCDRLASRGSTLIASNRVELPNIIRREYRAMRRAEKSEA